MIVKIKSLKRPEYQRLLSYMFRDRNRLKDKGEPGFVLLHNVKGRNIITWESQLKENESYRKLKRKNRVYLTHEIISWHRDDAQHITQDRLLELAREYLKQRNPKGMYVVTAHYDKEHYHLHVCASALEYRTGKSLRMSKADFQKLKKDFQDFQQARFPEMKHSLVQHDQKSKEQKTEKEYQYTRRTGRETDKDTVKKILSNCFQKAESAENFYQRITNAGLKPYIRGQKTTGIEYQKTKFRLNRLGFDAKKLKELDKTLRRGLELANSREVKPRIISRDQSRNH